MIRDHERAHVGKHSSTLVTTRRRGDRRYLIVAVVGALVTLVGGVIAVGGSRSPQRPVRLAFVAGLTGPNAASSEDMLHGAQLYLAEVNRAGGVQGRRVELAVYDDKDDMRLAGERAEQIARDGSVLGVIGHRTSSASLAAGPVYASAGLPVITPTSTADAVTKDNPWFFRMVFTNSVEGRFISSYLRNVLGEERIAVVAGTDDYSRNLSEGVLAGWPAKDAVQLLTLDTSTALTTDAVDDVATRAGAGANQGTVVLALPEEAAKQMVPALRRSGFRDRVFGGDTAGSEEFFQSLSALQGSIAASGDLTDNLYATAPLINDALTGDGVRWYSAFVAAYGKAPTWRAATSYQSASAMVNALRSKGVALGRASGADDRKAVRKALSDLNSAQDSLHGVIGPIWFDSERSSVMPINVGLGRGGHFVSAFDQLQPAVEPATSGLLVGSDGSRYQRKRVVTVGIKFNQITDLDTDAENFEANFFLWLKFSGGDDVTDIEFPNAVDPTTALGTPVRATTDGSASYRLYRVSGRFRTALEFHDFPFDRQALSIEVQHRSQPSSSVVYAADIEVFTAPQSERLSSGANAAEPVLAISDWVADQIDYFQATVGASTPLGDPTLRGGQTGLSYSRFVAQVTIHRDVRPFLVKNLLPLLLLAAATYASLFFSHSQTAERVTFGITGILTGAVLLAEVTSSLPTVGYTVAIQWGYYIFILLAAGCVLVGILGDGFEKKGDSIAIRRLDLVSRLAYPIVVVATVVAYLFKFH